MSHRLAKTATDARHRLFLGHLAKILGDARVDKTQITIGGSGYLGLMGLKKTNDLDVWADKVAFRKISSLPAGKKGRALSGSPVVKFRTPMGEIEFFTGTWIVGGHDYGGHRNTIVADGFRHWDRKKTLAWKRAMGRDKDMADIRALEKVAFRAGAMDKMARVRWGYVVGGGLAAGSGILAIYDLLKTRGFGADVKTIQDAISKGKLVDSREFVHKIDPKIKVLWTPREIRSALSKEPEVPKDYLKDIVGGMTEMVRSGTNAAALRGEHGEYIFAPRRTSAQVLAHEVGHILDFRAKNINIKNPGPYEEDLISTLWKPSYERKVMEAERRAWELAPGRKKETPLERAALGTYDKGFHAGRGALSTLTAATLVGAMAYNKYAAQTRGEYDAEVSAPGVTGQTAAPVDVSERTEARSGNKSRGRGVPEWVRYLKALPSKKTWDSGDNIGER